MGSMFFAEEIIQRKWVDIDTPKEVFSRAPSSGAPSSPHSPRKASGQSHEVRVMHWNMTS